MAAKVKERVGVPDVIVLSSAGGMQGGIDDTTADEFVAATASTVVASFYVVRSFIEDFFRRNSGHIVFIASAAYVMPFGAISYMTRTFGLLGFYEALKADLKRDPDMDVRRAVAVAGMEIFKRRVEEPPSGYVVNFTTPTTTERVDVDAFLGPRYDPQGKRLKDLPGGQYATYGYADAFLDPPHGLGLDDGEAWGLFDALNTELFASMGPDLDVRAWSTDWSNIFDAGKEYWGASRKQKFT